MGGQIVDATVVPVPVPVNHNKEAENATIKAGEVPAGWAENPAKLARKDRDARWTHKHGKSYPGYKGHVCIDRRHKLVRTIGMVRATAKIGPRHLAYTMHRFTFLEGAEALAT